MVYPEQAALRATALALWAIRMCIPVEPRMEHPIVPEASYSPPPIAEHTTST
jgi:hypothetical protein